jgi:hypothetical protein
MVLRHQVRILERQLNARVAYARTLMAQGWR